MSELHSLGVPDETHVMNTPAIRPRAMVHRIASYAHLAAVIPALVVPGLGGLGGRRGVVGGAAFKPRG